MKVLEFIYKYLTIIKEWVLSFLNKTFSVTSSKSSKITGLVIGGLTLLISVIFSNQFTSQTFSSKWMLLAIALVMPFILYIITAYTITFKNSIANKTWHILFIFLLPIITITMTECLNGVYIYDMTYLGFIGNYAVVFFFYILLFGLTGSLKISYSVVTSILYGFALAHSYILEFRGTPFLPMDFLGITTAVGVANTYNYTPTYKMILATLLFVFIMVVAIKTKTPKYNILVRIISRSTVSVFCISLLIVFYTTNFFAKMGAQPDFWNQARGYHNYGFVWNYFCNTKYLRVSVPKDYNSENIDDYVEKGEENEDKPVIDNSYRKPNIICIMNESLSDLRALGNIETNEEYMPFINSLTENTVKGNLYVPVIGAGTSNTEFEFLTGHTTSFLPSGSNAYMLYVKNPIASLVSTLEAQGYSSSALHPYYADGWNRTEVYSNLGIDKFISLEDIIPAEILPDYRANGSKADYLQALVETVIPDKNVLIRQYVSDEYNYELLIEDFENRDKTKPYFAFNVTMQNHGGYTTSSENFDECIYTTSTSKPYNKANKYLSLIKASDDAFKGLLGYFSKVKEPTIICMFGDHQPTIESEFIAEVLGVDGLSNLTSEQEQSRHKTPFIIWANYDIEEQYIDKLSSNYLSSLVLKTAGVKLTEYNEYLLELSKTLPVIDTVGYIDSQNNYYKWSQKSDYTEKLNNYEKAQYNNIFDQKNVNRNIFYLNDFVIEPTPIEETEE